MSYSDNFEPAAATDQEKNLVAAIREGAWEPAIDLVKDIDGFTLRRAAETGIVAAALVRFLSEAPDEAVINFREAAELCELRNHHVSRYRRSALMLVSEAHLELALQCGDIQQLAGAHFHTVSAIDVLPRSKEHEAILAGGIAHFIRIVARCEARWATARPDLELDPKLLAPHPSVVRNIVNVDGYDPDAVADLIRRAGNACCSQAVIVTALQFALADAHWPTWRAILLLSAGEPERLRAAAKLLRNENLPLSQGASQHLTALLEGYRPVQDCIVPDTGDDVPF